MNILLDTLKNIYPNTELNGNNINCSEVILSNGNKVKINITIEIKTDKISYSTTECLNDRLNTIKKLDNEKYIKVLQNIKIAKKVLNGIDKGKILSEEGIENWILQNGGSFKKAINSFMSVPQNSSYKDFCSKYTIWDFGESNNGIYSHKEFIKDDMDEEGYNNMCSILKQYMNQVEMTTKKEK